MNKPLGNSFQVNLWQDDEQLFLERVVDTQFKIEKQEDI